MWSGWALQTILQVLGAILLAGAGLVFTVFAWGSLSLGTRGAILVGITATVFFGARRAARANLRSSAEVIAALGSALVVLDAWVLLATLRGGGDAATTMACALLVGAAVLVPLGRGLALTTASVVGLVCLTLAPAVLATALSWAPGAVLLLAGAAALCLLGRYPGLSAVSGRATATPPASGPVPAPSGSSSPVFPTVSPTPAAGAATPARTVLTVLAPCYLALAAFLTLVALLQLGPAQTVAPLVGIAVVGGLWAASLPAHANRGWSAVVGISLVLAGAAGAAALIGTASPRALMWLLPLGAVAGLAATIGVVRVVPRTGVAAARAGWIVVLVSGLLPASATALMLVAFAGGPVLPGAASSSAPDAVPILAGLVVMVVATPLLHLLGGRLITAQTDDTVPRPPRALVDHVLGASVVAATVLLLGLPLVLPGAVWPVATQLALVTLVALVSGRLTSGRAPGSPLGERFTSLVRSCLQLFCALAVTWAAIASLALASGVYSPLSPRGGQALVAAAFAVAGLVLWVARDWGLAGGLNRGGNRAALTFASLIIASVGVGILARVVVQLASFGWYAAPLPLVLVLVALGARDLRSSRPAHAGTADGLSAGRAPRRRLDVDHLAALSAAAVLVAPGCVITATIATATADPDQALAVTLVAAALLVITVILTWQLSFGAGAPAQDWLRATAGALSPVVGVLTLLSLRPVAVAGDLVFATLDWPLVVLGLLVVLITWVGTTAPGPARLGCEGAVVAVAASTVLGVVTQGGDVRMTLALAISAVGALAYAVVSGRHRWGWLALGLGVCASWVSLSGSDLPLEAYTAPAGAVVVAVGVWQLVASLRTAAPDDRTEHAVRFVLAGLTVLILPTFLLTPEAGAHGRAVVALVCVLWLGGTAQLLTVTKAPLTSRLRPLAVGMNVLAVVGASIGLGGHGVVLASQAVADGGLPGQTTPSPVVAMCLWAAAAVLVTAALAVQLAHLRVREASSAERRLAVLVADPRVWGPTVCTILLTAPVLVLMAGDWFTTASAWVAATLVTVWGAVALLGTPPGVPRVRSSYEFALRAAPALVGAYVVALVGAYAAAPPSAGTGEGPLVWLLTWAGAFLAVVTVRATQVTPGASTWRTAVWGALATIVPLTLQMIADPSGGWVAAAMITAAAWLVLGVRLRWQAPIACGALGLVVQVAVLAGPPALAAMSGMLGWIVLAAVGGALLALGLTYERQITTARKVLHRYSELR